MHNIRNFCIIAHIDHGKSTLADRMLEVTGTVEARKMRPQYLDRLELERERGITIKMAPVRMSYSLSDTSYILNLIDTPGHSDFSYEVSRALVAVEGAVLLVDASKGIQAQTLSNFRAARAAGLVVIGALNKIDLFPDGPESPRARAVAQSLASLLGVSPEEIINVSGKTGKGVDDVLRAIVERVPPPATSRKTESKNSNPSGKALIFDSIYDEHKGILAFVRVVEGDIRVSEEVYFAAAGTGMALKEVGWFVPEFFPTPLIREGEIGYLATGLKDTGLVRIGDTVMGAGMLERGEKPLAGYKDPSPVVFISFYPDENTKFEELKRAFEKLRLNDAALVFEPESNNALGRGLKAGFLGQLHFDITASRLTGEFGVQFLTSFPTVAYRVRENGKEFIITQASDFPDKPEKAFQPMIMAEILTPPSYLNDIMHLAHRFDFVVSEVENAGEYLMLRGVMPLAELIRDFDDQLKSASQGFASFSYERAGEEEGDVEKLEILIVNDIVPALTRIVSKKDLAREARASVERLKELLPRAQFSQAIQAKAEGKIIARETIAALRKDVTGYLYGGDRTRKMKLWKKQKKGKERLKETAKVRVPVEVFREVLKK